MRKFGFLLLVLGMVIVTTTPGTSYATKSAHGNERVWAAGYPKLKSAYGQAIITVTVKYVVTPDAPTWLPKDVEYEVHTWANNDGTGWDASYAFGFNTNFSSEHDTTPITVGTGTKYFNVKGNLCTFRRMADGVTDPVSLEDSGYVQFRN